MKMSEPTRHAPSVAERVSRVRRIAGQTSLERFCAIYLPAHFRDEPSRMHREIGELLESATVERGERLAIAAPRGHAKSTLVSLGYVLWSIVYGTEKYIVLISNTAEQASDLLSFVKAELTTNDRLLEDFPEVCEPLGQRPGPERWRKDEIITRDGASGGAGTKVTALGAEKKIRGRRHRQDRPTLIIADDIENESEARSEDQRRNKAEWFNKAVLKAGSAETNVVVVGTVLHYDSVLAQLLDPLKSPGWSGHRYQAVMSWSTRPELWETWEQVYCHREEHEGASGPEAARAFFESSRDAMLEGTEVLWPAREPYDQLMELRLREGRASFDSEKQNDPVNPEDCYFREEDFRFWDDEFGTEQELLASLSGGVTFYGACDPSLGKRGRQHDDTAIVTIVRHDASGVLYVLDADVRRRKPDSIIEAVIAHHRLRSYSRFGFEAVQFQEFLGEELRRRSRVAGTEVPVQDVRHSTDKLGRIQRLQPLVTSGGIRFSRRHKTLVEQLRQFPMAAHDDGPDALEMAVGLTEATPFRAEAIASSPGLGFSDWREERMWTPVKSWSDFGQVR